MWDALDLISKREELNINALATEIDRRRGDTSLTSATRVFILEYFRRSAEDAEAGEGEFQTSARAEFPNTGRAVSLMDRIFG